MSVLKKFSMQCNSNYFKKLFYFRMFYYWHFRIYFNYYSLTYRIGNENSTPIEC